MWPFTSKPKVYTGKTLIAPDIKAMLGPMGVMAQFGKVKYAEVNSAAVIPIAQATRDALFSAGVTKWQKTATCTVFAARFAELGQERFFSESFQDFISSDMVALAVADIWFTPDGGGGFDHAIGLCITEKGVMAIDPQVPDVLRVMTENEKLRVKSIRFL